MTDYEEIIRLRSALEAAQHRIQVLERDISRLDELWSAATVRALEAEKNQSFLDEAVTGACKDRDYFSAQLEAAEARLSTQQERIAELEAEAGMDRVKMYSRRDMADTLAAQQKLITAAEARLSTLTQRLQQVEDIRSRHSDAFTEISRWLGVAVMPGESAAADLLWAYITIANDLASSLLVEGETSTPSHRCP